MNTDTLIPKTIYEQLESGHPVVLASIVDIQGSSPRHRGAKMVVCADGKSYGTIGGSLFEAKATEEARRILVTSQPRFMDFDFDDSKAYSGGMICGGKATVLLDYIPDSQENIGLFRCWYKSVMAGTSFYFLSYVSYTKMGISILGHSLLFPDGKSFGDAVLSPSHLEMLSSEIRNISATTIVPIGDTRVVVDPIKKLQTLYCLGAGHVAVPTAHIAALAGFRIVVLDDRTEFANAERFPNAEQINVIKDYSTALEGVEIDKDSYIVIMTRGHQYDQEVLEQALKTQASYIGMISSRKKRNSVYRALLAKGIRKQELERVHSPIGMAIGSETPEEIAVSIVAQLIKERSRLVA
ncbi:MAG TPA: XdhC/CoxI family protein [Dehalococcoidales bacterium]